MSNRFENLIHILIHNIFLKLIIIPFYWFSSYYVENRIMFETNKYSNMLVFNIYQLLIISMFSLQKPIEFLPNYKNPCWYGTETNGPINDGKLHCLPYFYLIGNFFFWFYIINSKRRYRSSLVKLWHIRTIKHDTCNESDKLIRLFIDWAKTFCNGIR